MKDTFIPEDIKLELEKAKNKIFNWFSQSTVFSPSFINNFSFFDFHSFTQDENTFYSVYYIISFEGLEGYEYAISYNIIEYPENLILKKLDCIVYYGDDKEEQLYSGDLNIETFNRIILDIACDMIKSFNSLNIEKSSLR